MIETDVFVAGGGPSGLAAAIAARKGGFTVTLADVSRPPIDKACGEGIMPDGLAALAELGITLPADKTAPFQGIRFVDSNHSVEARFTRGYGLGMRRTVLHQTMVDRAAEVGVTMLWGSRVTALTSGGVLVDGTEIRCRWVVGADGLHSRVRGWRGLDGRVPATVRRGFRRHFEIKPWSECVEVHWTGNGQLYVTPVSDSEVCIALVTRDHGLRLEEAIARCSSLPNQLRRAAAVTREQGGITASLHLDSVVRDNCALIGEASGCVDAVTGEGLSLAFRQALALEKALCADDLSLYQAQHRKLMRLPRIMAGAMLLMDRKHGLRERALRAFSADPELFGQMLAVHTGAASPLAFALRGTTSLGWHMLTA
jgi:flavin-dependent dehydrogenase